MGDLLGRGLEQRGHDGLGERLGALGSSLGQGGADVDLGPRLGDGVEVGGLHARGRVARGDDVEGEARGLEGLDDALAELRVEAPRPLLERGGILSRCA